MKKLLKGFVFAFIAVYCLAMCVDPMFELDPSTSSTGTTINETSGYVLTTDSLMQSTSCSTCTFIVPFDNGNIDGAKLKVKPGDIICLQSGVKYGPLRFINLEGAEDLPVTITNCGSKAIVDAFDKEYSIKILQSHNIRITGGNDDYGILLRGGRLGLTMDYLSTDFEIDHIEVSQVGFAGIMAKTDPSCDDRTIRQNFTMRNVLIHHNFVHATGGEGIYVGSSFYGTGVKKDCGVRLPHAIENVKIYNNLVQLIGWDGIQLGSAVQGAAVYNNDIKFFGTAGKAMQNSGIQIGEGTGGLCYNNLIKDGTGNGITMLGLGDNITAGNIIIGAGGAGIFCDDRYTLGSAFQFIDNIIINPKQQGIRLYSDKVENIVRDNLIINPPVLSQNLNLSPNSDFVFRLNANVKLVDVNNLYTRNISKVKDIYEEAFRFSALTTGSNLTISNPILKIQDLLTGSKVPLDLH